MANETAPAWWPQWAPPFDPSPLIWTAVVVFVAWLLVRGGQRALIRSAQKMAKHRQADEQLTKAIVGRTKPARMLLNIAVASIAIIALLGVWGLKTAFAGLLAGAGFAGIVIGMAAGDTIGDVIAGFLIFYNHPFDLGDWVEIDGHQGIVEDVALGATTIITFDNEKLTIPNRLVESNTVKNFTHARRLRTRIVVGVEYGTHLGQAMQTLVELANDHPVILDRPVPQAVSIGFGDSSVNLELRFWVEPVRNSVIAVKTDLIHAIHDRFRKDNIGIAFPHIQLHQPAPFRVDSA